MLWAGVNLSDNQSGILLKKSKSKKGSAISEVNNEILGKLNNDDNVIYKDNFSGKKVYNEFINFISCNENEKMENDFKQMSQGFFNNIYDKKNNNLDFDVAKIRKKLCIKIFKLLNKLFPNIKEDFLKKVIIYFEYKIRNDESNFNKIYSSKLNGLIKKIKEKFYDIKR